MLQSERSRDRVTAVMAGELDHCNAAQMRAELDRLLADPAVRHMTLDMSALSFMDSSGIGVLLGRYKALRLRGGTLSVCRMNPQIKRVFHLSGLDQVIQNLDEGRRNAK